MFIRKRVAKRATQCFYKLLQCQGLAGHPNAGQKVLTPSRYLKASYLRASYLQASYLQASALVSFQALIYVYGAGRQEVLGSPGRSQ
jgi:hypothetical protein